MQKGIWVATFALAAAFVACGGSSQSSSGGTGGGGGSAGTAAETACAALSKARCSKHDGCTNGVYVKNNFTDEAACESRESLTCLAALQAPGTKVDAAHDQACATAIDGEGCPDLLGPTPPDACVPPAGTRANGQPCAFNGQCQSTYCAVPEGAACGACAAEPAAGDSCALTGSCGRGLICSSDKVCQVPATAGQACHKDHDCAVGLGCVGDTKATPGKCMAAGETVGASCDATVGPPCDRTLGLYCSPTSHTCASVGFAAAGQACGNVQGSEVICLAGASCQPSPTAKGGTCVAPAADGAACAVGGEPHCLAPARCVASADGGSTGTCQVPSASGC